MIKQITKITGTGKFLNYRKETLSTNQQLPDFQQVNFFYGENGTGKTTLASVLRSWKGDDDLMLKRRSFDKTLPQEVRILTENETVVFDGKTWSAHNPNLEIFDVHFINENIFTGLEIQNDHKKKLFEIILGDEGIKIKNEIAHIKERIRNGGKVIREASKVLEAAIENSYSALEYAELEFDPEVDERIKDKEHELDTAQNFQNIIQKPALSMIPKLDLTVDFEKAKAILATSIESISEEYLEKLNAHKSHLKPDEKAEEWLKLGFENKGENCPFCQQKLDKNSEIILAYSQYFNENYNDLISNLKSTFESLKKFNLEAYLLEVENRIIGNLNLIDFWKKHLPNSPELTSIIEEKESFLDMFEKVKSDFSEKTANPVQMVSNENLEAFEQKIFFFGEKIMRFNSKIAGFNESIGYMKSADAPDVPRIELELKQLKALKKRNDEEIVEHCDNLKKYTAGVEKLKVRKDEKQAQLRILQDRIFKNFLAQINKYLQDFAPYLEIRNLSAGYMGSSTEPVVKYGLRVNGNELKHKESGLTPSVKYSMSEGDKCALALSFFLAKLSVDPDLENKIIVVDDPVASFDRFRLSKMINYLIYFGSKSSQLFFLTHNYLVGKEFVKRAKGKNLGVFEGKILAIEESSVLVMSEE